MNRILTKTAALFLCLATVVTLTQFGSAPTFAATTDFTVVNGVLTKYTGTQENVRIPTTVKTIGDYAFQECTEIEKIVILESVTTIGRYAFAQCENIKKITVPNSVTAIGNFAFYECTGLKSITLSSQLKTIGISSFSGCSSLTEIVIPNTVTSIGKKAFEGCSDLDDVTVASNIKNIGDDVFSGCSNVTIGGYENTEIQKYVDKYNKRFKSLGLGTLMLDTKNVVVAPRGTYIINYKLIGGGLVLKAYSSKSKIAKVSNIDGGQYQVTGLKTGTTYIMFDVYNKSKKLIGHASVKVIVRSGAVSRGDKAKQTAKF
jgi:hypothetical protein